MQEYLVVIYLVLIVMNEEIDLTRNIIALMKDVNEKKDDKPVNK